MKFIVGNEPFIDMEVPEELIKQWKVIQIEPKPQIIVALFVEGLEDYHNDLGIGKAMAHDYCDFLNDKYCDKEINKEWPGINRYERIKYHLEQLQLLRSDKKLHWNEHGNMVE